MNINSGDYPALIMAAVSILINVWIIWKGRK